MILHRAGSRPSTTANPEYFTGHVRMDSLISTPAPARTRGISVTFEPGARTNWHTHPLGQTLIITTGVGLVQKEGEPVTRVHPGDVIWFAPGERHWHGAIATCAMTHIALQEEQDGETATWFEPVTDAQYNA